MSYTDDMKRIKTLEKKLNERIGVNGHWESGFNDAYGYFVYDNYITWAKANPTEAKPLEKELEMLKEKWAKELAEKEAKKIASTKRAKAKRYRTEIEELENRLAYLKKWLANYETEEEA